MWHRVVVFLLVVGCRDKQNAGVAAGVFSTSRYVGSIVASGTLAALLGSTSVHSTGAGTAGGEGLPWYLAVLAIAASLSALAGLGIGTAPCAPR